jgi:hypothetical protein
MRNSGRPAKLGYAKCLRLILLTAVVVGCQSLSFDPRGRTVPETSWISLPQSGESSGTWTNEDLTLLYKFVRNQSQLNVSGTIQFADRITDSFLIIQYFHLDAIPVDARGKVLDMIGLTTAGQVNTLFDRSVDFRNNLTLPPDTAAIAFSYRGRAYEGDGADGGGIMDFWEYPVY